jgi:hypothetical protein
MIEDDLEEIRASLERLGRWELLDRLQPGLASHLVRDRLATAGLGKQPDLEALYGWRNGTRAEGSSSLGSICLFPGFYLLSLDDAFANYSLIRADRRWDPAWLPVFANDGGDFYAVDTAADPGPVVDFMNEEPEQPVEHESLSGMIRTLADCFREGVFYVDGAGYLEMDDVRYAAVTGRNNPG